MNTDLMKNAPMTLSEEGENTLLRVSLATTFVSELLSGSSYDGNRSISGEGAAALLACLANQMDSVIKQSNRMCDEVRHDKH